MIRASAIATLAGCFAPTLQVGLPCSEHDWCPEPQHCDIATNICVEQDVPVVDANIMFVTAEPIMPYTLTGPSDGDVICQQAAELAGLPPNTYKAWLSYPGDDAIDRIGTGRGWVRSDGKPFADTVADIAAGRIFYPPNVDETIRELLGVTRVATASSASGTSTFNDCASYTGEMTAYMTAGYADAGWPDWTDGGAVMCSEQAHLYCFGINKNVEVKPPMAEGRRAFLTEHILTILTGVSSLDDHCKAEAGSASFKALVATSAASAASRFMIDPSRPWKRDDGVIVSDRLDRFSAPLSLTQTGRYANDYVYFGADYLNQVAFLDNTCGEWTTTGQSTFAAGLSSRSGATGDAFAYSQKSCAGQHVYCLEE